MERAPILAAGAGRRKEIFVRLEALLDSARNRMPSASHPLVLGAGLLLLFAVSQSTPYSHLLGFGGYRIRHLVTDDQTRREFKLRGDIDFTADDQDVAHMTPGSKLVIVAGDRWLPRQIEIEAGPNGEISRLYFSGGIRQPYDKEAERFLGRELSTWLRNEPINLSDRLSRWLTAGGPEGALREIRTVGNDHTKRLYLEELLLRVSPTEELLRRTLRIASEINSDSEKRTFLADTARRFRGLEGPVLGFVDTLNSDHDRRTMLIEMAAELPPAMLTRFAASVSRINSDHDRAEILLKVLGPSAESLGPLLAVVPGIGSDHDKARVLKRAIDIYVDAPPVRASFFGALDAISTDHERREVLQKLLHRPALSPESLAAVAAAAKRLSSEHDRHLVLNELSALPSMPDVSRETR